jgi:hypothetical protein
MKTVTPPRPAALERQGWRDRAACAGEDPDLFFAEDDADGELATRKALAICGACPVSAPCLEFAVTSGERWGIWGGVPEQDRAGMGPGIARPGLCNKSLHVMNAANTYTNPDGVDRCRACGRARETELRLDAAYKRKAA